MCGIAGILRFGGSFRPGEVEAMTARVSHRGPDGDGFFCREGIAFGHRRLSIIDPRGGAQPMTNEDESIWVTFNGEIYNFVELREELQTKGHIFQTHCDTEVLVHGYEEWGEALLGRLRGMFAFAVADFKARVLFVARDPFGIKPLVYRSGEGYFSFASEIEALRAVQAPVPTGNLQAVDFFLRYQYIPAPHTIYKDSFKLLPGHCVKMSMEGPFEAPTRYWSSGFAPQEGVSTAEWVERASATVEESVKAHLVSDVPFGVFLSGGVDSTLVARDMSRLLEQPVQAFTIGFEEAAYSEIEYARTAAKKLGVELHSEVISQNALGVLPELVSRYGEPFGDPSCIPTYYVSRLARSQVPMVLSGDGGDELFGGYNSYTPWMVFGPHISPISQFQNYAKAKRPKAALRALAGAFKGGRQEAGHDVKEWEAIMLYLQEFERLELWHPQHATVVGTQSEIWQDAGREAQGFDRLAFAQWMDIRTYLPHAILTKVDIASMAHGLEVRTPLVDLKVWELAQQLPTSERFRADVGRGTGEGKLLLKRLLERDFDAAFVNRRKQGFGIPRAEWFAKDGQGRGMLMEVLADSPQLREWFKPEAIQGHLDAHQKPHDHSGILWLLLVLGLWLRSHDDIVFE